MKNFRKTSLLILLTTVAIFASATAYAQLEANDRKWLELIRTDHPRLFLTAEDIPLIISNATSSEHSTFQTMQQRINRLLDKNIVFKDVMAPTGERNKVDYYGYRAAESAMLWLITRDKRYLTFAKNITRKLTDYYNLRVANDLNIQWYAFTQIATLCAYDWIYNDLEPTERKEIGEKLYHALYNVAWHGPNIRPERYRENRSGYTSGFYGTPVLPWYIGLTFYNEGINDKECVNMLCNGYDNHQKLAEYRASLGGCYSGVVSYALGAHPYAEYDFIYTFRSATGIDITPKMEHMLGLFRYIDWSRLPNNLEFGIGDTRHFDNKMPRNATYHVKEIANTFYATHPEIASMADELLSRYNDPDFLPNIMPFMPLLHRYHCGSEWDKNDSTSTQSSAYFDSVGHIFMRSGVGDDDTYAVFLTARKNRLHQHFDVNNFIIYKHGYRTIDSGTRPQPGLHLSHYFSRTVAHNCITIRMPDEQMPYYWGEAASNEDADTPVPNDGGQNNRQKGALLAYEESAEWVYIASDATEAYHKDKAELVVREFIWIKPDIFIIYDRVVSDKAEYPKKWLYHTVSKPIVNGKTEFAESSQGGKSICRTLLPKGSIMECIGGEGKQFWSDGKNWPIAKLTPSDYNYKRRHLFPDNNHPLVGQWRVEVSPKKAATHDHFLHIIQVGDEKLAELPKTKCEDKKECAHLSFEYEGCLYDILFDKTKSYGCQIKINKLLGK